MNKIFIFTLIALTATACETSTSIKKPTESSQLQEPIAEITPVSRIVPEVTPSSIPTLKAVPEPDLTIKQSAQLTKPLERANSQADNTANPIVKSAAKPVNSNQKIEKSIKSADKPVNSTQENKKSAKPTDKLVNSNQKIEKFPKSTNNTEKPVSIDKLVTNISSKIGCGKVDQKYKIRVATIALRS